MPNEFINFMLRDIYFYIQRSSKFFRQAILFIVELLGDQRSKKQSESPIRIGYNGYSTGPKSLWFQDFIHKLTGNKVAPSWYRPSLIICSSFGSFWLLKIILKVFNCPSLFFSEENLATLKKYREYKNYLDGQPSLAMGFDFREEENYRRFPLWLIYLFTPEFAVTSSVEDIQEKLDEIERRAVHPKTNFAAMVASHDGYALSKKVYGLKTPVSRSAITEKVGQISRVDCPGKLLHNDDSLKNEFNDDKKAYLRQFAFNICAENAAVKGYVTEKLFEALEAGTIPIYWGDPEPEPGIINPDRVLFWDELAPEKTISRINKLYKDKDAWEEFMDQPLFADSAADKIHEYFLLLRKDMLKLLKKRND